MKKYMLCFISMLMGVCAYAQDGVAALAEEGFDLFVADHRLMRASA